MLNYLTRKTALDAAFGVKFPSQSKRALSLTEGVGIFICKDLRPYSVVENDGFRLLVKRLEPRYVLPSRKHLSERVIPDMYAKSKDAVANSLHCAERVALTCDCWTSRNTISYLTITCHYIDEQWRLASSVLQTRAVETSHTASNLADLLTEAIQKWDISDKDPAVVTDNAANIVRAVQLTGHFHMGCFAHLINLASESVSNLDTLSDLSVKHNSLTDELFFSLRSETQPWVCYLTKRGPPNVSFYLDFK